jgi:DNA polymerase-3 subunit chi
LRADFYHLTRLPLERGLPAICERVAGQGQKLLVMAQDEALLARLDQLLWTWKAESFLPHARAGAGDADRAQSVLLATPDEVVSATGDAAGEARHIALVDGEWRDLALAYDRAFYLFDESTIAGARQAWRALAAQDGVERHYWKQDDEGRWREGP